EKGRTLRLPTVSRLGVGTPSSPDASFAHGTPDIQLSRVAVRDHVDPSDVLEGRPPGLDGLLHNDVQVTLGEEARRIPGELGDGEPLRLDLGNDEPLEPGRVTKV